MVGAECTVLLLLLDSVARVKGSDTPQQGACVNIYMQAAAAHGPKTLTLIAFIMLHSPDSIME